MTSPSPEHTLAAFRVPTKSNWYALGVGQSRVTVHTQQVRALNLAWALRESGAVGSGPVLVIGGGAAGLTVAAGLAHHGIESLVLERERHLLPLQRNCRKRHLHPHIFDWPDEGSENTHAELPLLDWRAGMACDVAHTIEASFAELKLLSKGKLEARCGVEQINLDSPAAGRVTWFESEKSLREGRDYSALIFAVGFGLESNFWLGRRGSYWADDSLEQHGVAPRGRYLVSGAGGLLRDGFGQVRREPSCSSALRSRVVQSRHCFGLSLPGKC